MAVFENRFSWSKSRHEKFEECRRQYFLYYYGSWGGWDRRADEEIRELYLLKKLTNRYAWVGTAVHDAIKRVLTGVQAGQLPDPQRVTDMVRASMRAQFRESRDGAYRSRKAFGLLEHEYQEAVSNEEWKRGWEQVESCIAAFYSSRWIATAQAIPAESWLPIDELGSFPFRGIPVFAAPDFAFRSGDGVVVVDWKTGRQRESDKEQLLGYALYAMETWGVPLERIDCKVVYLPGLEEVEVETDAASLDAFQSRMAASIETMRGLLRDPEANAAEIDAFPKTQNEEACRRCAFRRPCLG